MTRPYFAYSTTRSYVVAFASIFNGLKIKDGWGNLREVPIRYAPRQKWLENIQANSDIDEKNIDTILPRMAFEFLSMQYDPSRMTNALNKVENINSTDPVTQESYILNRLPYNFNVKLYVAAVRFNDLLQILEQIVPFFNPSLTVTINDTNGFGYTTNLPVTLNSVNYDINYEGTFDTRRVISADLDFTLRGYQYSNPRVLQRIQEVIINLTAVDLDVMLDQLLDGNFVPNPDDSETIISINENAPNPPSDINTSVSDDGYPEFQVIASTNLEKAQIVSVMNGQAYVPNLTDINDVSRLAGATITAATQGSAVTIARAYLFEDPTWNFVPGRVYCSTTGGLMTQNVPTSGAVVEVGNAISPTEIMFELQPASYFI